jgi:hypothetical protein
MPYGILGFIEPIEFKPEPPTRVPFPVPIIDPYSRPSWYPQIPSIDEAVKRRAPPFIQGVNLPFDPVENWLQKIELAHLILEIVFPWLRRIERPTKPGKVVHFIEGGQNPTARYYIHVRIVGSSYRFQDGSLYFEPIANFNWEFIMHMPFGGIGVVLIDNAGDLYGFNYEIRGYNKLNFDHRVPQADGSDFLHVQVLDNDGVRKDVQFTEPTVSNDQYGFLFDTQGGVGYLDVTEYEQLPDFDGVFDYTDYGDATYTPPGWELQAPPLVIPRPKVYPPGVPVPFRRRKPLEPTKVPVPPPAPKRKEPKTVPPPLPKKPTPKTPPPVKIPIPKKPKPKTVPVKPVPFNPKVPVPVRPKSPRPQKTPYPQRKPLPEKQPYPEPSKTPRAPTRPPQRGIPDRTKDPIRIPIPIPYPDRIPTPDPVPTPDPDPDPKPKPKPKPKPNPDPTHPRPYPVPVPIPVIYPIPDPYPFPIPYPIVTPTPEPIPIPNPYPIPVPIPIPVPRIPVPPIPTQNPYPIPIPPIVDPRKPPVVCDPCVVSIQNSVDSLLRKISNPVSGAIISQGCEPTDLTTFPYSGDGFGGISSQLDALSSQIDLIRKQVCNIRVETAFPAHWNTKAPTGIPQCVLLLAPFLNGKLRRANTTITVPHWKFSKNESQAFSFYFATGNWLAQAWLSDGSKIKAFCSTEQEAHRVLTTLQSAIYPSYWTNRFSVGQTSTGYGAIPRTVYLKFADYYSTGRESDVPDWSLTYV